MSRVFCFFFVVFFFGKIQKSNVVCHFCDLHSKVYKSDEGAVWTLSAHFFLIRQHCLDRSLGSQILLISLFFYFILFFFFFFFVFFFSNFNPKGAKQNYGRRHSIFFIIISRGKQDLKFCLSRLPNRRFAWNAKPYFLCKITKSQAVIWCSYH